MLAVAGKMGPATVLALGTGLRAVVAAACLAAAPAIASTGSGDYRTLPVGAVVKYDSWTCKVTRSEGLETVCEDGKHSMRLYGKFVIHGLMPKRHYGGAISSVSCGSAYGAGSGLVMDIERQRLDRAGYRAIERLWPLKVGANTKLTMRHGEGKHAYVALRIRVSERLRVVVGDRPRDVFVVTGTAEYPDCANHFSPNYQSSLDDQPMAVKFTWWYEAKTGLVVKYRAAWPPDIGREESYELVNANFPEAPRVLSVPGGRFPSPSARDEISPEPAAPAPQKRKKAADVASAATRTPDGQQRNASRLRRKGSATGFWISRFGHVVTNDHVLNRCTEMRVPGTLTGQRIATIVARDNRNDLAVLKVDTRPKHIARFRSGQQIRLGEEIVVYGYPLRGLLAAGGNLTIGIVSAKSGIRGDTRHLQITAPVQQGNSGGPLLDRSGNVVGVVMSKLDAVRVAKITGDIPQNINFAIKTPMVRAFLDVHDVPYETRASVQELKVVEVSDQAATFTVVVECWR